MRGFMNLFQRPAPTPPPVPKVVLGPTGPKSAPKPGPPAQPQPPIDPKQWSS